MALRPSSKARSKACLRQSRNTGEKGGLWVPASGAGNTAYEGAWPLGGSMHRRTLGSSLLQVASYVACAGKHTRRDKRLGQRQSVSHDSNQLHRRRRIRRKERGPPTVGLVVHDREWSMCSRSQSRSGNRAYARQFPLRPANAEVEGHRPTTTRPRL
jgi:hypothetical protein